MPPVWGEQARAAPELSVGNSYLRASRLRPGIPATLPAPRPSHASRLLPLLPSPASWQRRSMEVHPLRSARAHSHCSHLPEVLRVCSAWRFSMPVETGWCRDFSREPRPEPEEQMAATAGCVCSRERTLPRLPAELRRGPGAEEGSGLAAQTSLRSQRQPRNPAWAHVDCPQPRELWPAASHKAGHKPPCPEPGSRSARAAPPRHTAAGRELPLPRAPWTWRLSVQTRDGAAASARHAPLRGRQLRPHPTSRRLYEYCMAYIIFFLPK